MVGGSREGELACGSGERERLMEERGSVGVFSSSIQWSLWCINVRWRVAVEIEEREMREKVEHKVSV